MVLLAHMLVALGIITAATVLCAIGKLQSDALIALYGAAVGLLGGNAQSLGAAVINGGSKPDLTKLAESSPAALQQVMQTASGHTPPAANEHVDNPA